VDPVHGSMVDRLHNTKRYAISVVPVGSGGCGCSHAIRRQQTAACGGGTAAHGGAGGGPHRRCSKMSFRPLFQAWFDPTQRGGCTEANKGLREAIRAMSGVPQPAGRAAHGRQVAGRCCGSKTRKKYWEWFPYHTGVPRQKNERRRNVAEGDRGGSRAPGGGGSPVRRLM
jgi:hypothetical protein